MEHVSYLPSGSSSHLPPQGGEGISEHTQNLYIKADPALDFYAIIALSTQEGISGPAIGGCRCIEYSSTFEAIYDAMRLAHLMSQKARLANLNHGGAKAVLIKPKHIKNREAYFAKFAEFINELQGKYITAVDSGTSPADMDIINYYSEHVVCTSEQEKIGGGASRYTALGVSRGIQAAVKFKLGKDSLAGLHVAIQGAGNVAYYLAKKLHSLGAKLTICDSDNKKAQNIAQEFNAQVIHPDEIYNIPCDVFAPCALGGILNPRTIPLIQAPIIAGAANNQLDSPNSTLLLQQRSILYIPDFAINSGGLIYAAAMYNKTEINKIQSDTEDIYNTIMNILSQNTPNSQNKSTDTIAC